MNYLNKSKLKRITAIALAAVMTAQIFTGCSDTATSSDSTSGAVSDTQSSASSTSSDSSSDTSSDTTDEEEDNVVEASSVEFNESGEYATTLTSAEIDLSDIKAEDVTVSYDIVDVDGYINAQVQAEENYEKALDELAASAVESEDDLSDMTLPELELIDIEKYVSSKNVEVKSVSAEKDKLELSFKDPDAATELTGFYTISLNKKYNDADVTVDLSVNFKNFELTPNIDSVLSNAEETRLTLELNDGSFADNVTEEDITLSGSFEDMTIDSLSCSGKNLTMQLVGKPTKPDGLAYVDGVVSVRPQAIKEAGYEVRACVPIELIANNFDASTLKADGDKVTAQLELIGTAKPLDELKAEDIKFENDVTVTDIKKVDDTHVELTMTVNGATDANSAADILNDQKLTIADDELTVSAAKAHFYPVFDAIKQDGDDLKLTIIAYVENGSFSDDIKAEQVTLGEDFESGKVVSAEKQNDTTARIVLTVPANGQTAEEFSLDGSITLKAGAMNSAWGDATDEDYTYYRNFSMESLGRVGVYEGTEFGMAFPFGNITNAQSLTQINKLFNTHLQNMFAAGAQNPWKSVTSFRLSLEQFINENFTLDGAMTASLEATALSSLKTIARAQVAGMAMSVAGLAVMAFSFCSDLGLVGENKVMIDTFKKTEQRTEQLKETVENEYHRLCGLKAAALKTIVTEFEVRLGDLQQYIDICSAYFTEKCCDDLGVEMPKELLPDATASQFCYDVSVALTDACRNRDAGYESYQQDFNMLMKQFDLVCNQLLLGDGGDPLTALDQAYANIDNFSTTSYMLKKGYRANVLKTLQDAMNLIRWYKLASYKLETDADGELIIHKGATEEEDYYSFDMDTIDLTDEDLFDAACERLFDMTVYDDGSIVKYQEENNLTFEQQMRNSDYFKMYYDHLTANHCQYALLLATRYYCQRYNITQEKMDEDYNIKLEGKDVSKYQSDVFSEKEGVEQMADMVANPISATWSTVQDNEPGGHWATDDYGPIQTYIQESGSEVRHEVKEDRPYCYSLNTYVSLVDNCYLSDSQFRAYTNYTDLQVTEFFNRLEDSGRTLLEELTNAGIPISEEYANQAKQRGNGGDNADPNNLYGIALTHSSGKTGGLIKKSWNTYANLCYWDAKKKDDICKNRSMVWHGRNNTAVNKIAVLVP